MWVFVIYVLERKMLKLKAMINYEHFAKYPCQEVQNCVEDGSNHSVFQKLTIAPTMCPAIAYGCRGRHLV
jgi:hypothetical protein